MNQPHIAVFTQPGRGHLYPLLELLELLVKRGYHVTCAVPESTAQHVSKTGAQPIVCDFSTKALTDFRNGRWGNLWGDPHNPAWWESFATSIYPWLIDIAQQMLKQLRGTYESRPPDLVLYDRLAFAGRIVAKSAGVKAVQMYPHFAFYKDLLHRERGICINPLPMIKFSEELDSFLASNGIKTRANLWHTEDLNIYFIPRDFQHHSDYFDDRSCFVGACINRHYESTWRNTAGRRPVILVSDMESLGDASFYRAVIEALGGRDYHVVLSIESQVSGDSLRPLPNNFEVTRTAPHLEILQHASLAFCHGGTGTVLEALYNGVPVIASPVSPPTAETAYRLIELGLGVILPRNELSSVAIRNSVEGLLTDNAFQSQVQRTRDLFRSSGGAEMAADKIEAYFRMS